MIVTSRNHKATTIGTPLIPTTFILSLLKGKEISIK